MSDFICGAEKLNIKLECLLLCEEIVQQVSNGEKTVFTGFVCTVGVLPDVQLALFGWQTIKIFIGVSD